MVIQLRIVCLAAVLLLSVAGDALAHRSFRHSNTVTIRPLALRTQMVVGRYEHGFTRIDSFFGAFGMRTTGGLNLFGLSAGYRRFVGGSYSRGAFFSPSFFYSNTSYLGSGLPVSGLTGTFGGKYTFGSSFVLEGELGAGIFSNGTFLIADLGLGWSF